MRAAGLQLRDDAAVCECRAGTDGSDLISEVLLPQVPLMWPVQPAQRHAWLDSIVLEHDSHMNAMLS
jgi:hypothetical protein